MSGFSFSLKGNKISKDKKGKSSITSKALPKKSTLFNEDDAPKDTKTAIDAFDSAQGAMSGTTAISKPQVLVIEPVNKSHTLRKTDTGAKPESSFIASSSGTHLSAEEKARKSLLTGESFLETNQKVISGHFEDFDAEINEQDYDDVPVDQFGAALLRGMGWSGETSSSGSAKQISSRKQGVVLGIGAKSVDADLEAELLSKKNLTVPLIRKSDRA